MKHYKMVSNYGYCFMDNRVCLDYDDLRHTFKFTGRLNYGGIQPKSKKGDGICSIF